jgi:hypothetical protein
MRLLIAFSAFLLSATLYAQNNSSLSFDGVDDYVELSNSISFGTNSFSVSIDCYLNAFEGSDSEPYSYIVGTPLAGASIDHGFKIQTSSLNFNGGFEAHINDAGTTDFNVLTYQNTSQTNVVLNQWYTLTMVVDRVNSEFLFYVDGTLVDSEIISPTFGDVDLGIPISIGHMSLNNTSVLDGSTDNLHIWSRALSQQEIQNYMSCPPSGNEEGLVGYWNFEEGSGTTAFDQTTNGNDGEVNGATWSTDVPEQSCQSDCTDFVACNYNPDATDDDGSCDYTCCPGPGCCGEGTVWDSDAQECFVANPTDTNFDGCTDLNDLLDILSAYGDCAEVNYSLSFDGVDDYVNYGDVMDMNSSFSVGAWAFSNGGNGVILSKHLFDIDTNPPWGKYTGFVLGNMNGEGLRLEIVNDRAGHGPGCPCGFRLSASTEPILNEWFHIVGVFESGQAVRLYINGLEVSQTNTSETSINDTGAPFYIGALHSNYSEGSLVDSEWDGFIDDVHIWNSALTQEQIQSYMSTPPTGNEEGLVGYWDFNEGTGSTLTDQTSNGNDGIINGATWSTDVPTSP